MSVNLHLSVKVSGYRPDKTDAIRAAIQAVFERESIDRDFAPLQESVVNGERVLGSSTELGPPLIISSSYKWIPEVQAALESAVGKANGAPCHVEFDGRDMDGDEDEFDDEEDDEDDEEDE